MKLLSSPRGNWFSVFRVALFLVFCFCYSIGHAQLPTSFQKVELVSGLKNSVGFEFAPDGRIFIIDRYGTIYIYKPDLLTTVEAGTLDVFHDMEDGLLGLAFDPDFVNNQFVYIHYSDATLPKNRVSRFHMNGDQLDISSEVVLIEWTSDRNGYYHAAGDLDFDSEGNLYIAIGDNTNHTAYAALHESDANQSAERTSSNTNDLRGKILRIKPQPDGTYTIPSGNLFPSGTGGRPEIYVMGARNPYKIFVDKTNTDWLFWGEVGPDANVESDKGPEGLDEINLVKTAGNYGWPYLSGKNEPFLNTYSNPPFYYDHANPVNISKWNTGATTLPAARPAWLDFFHGCYLAGPRYYYDPAIVNPRKLPSDFNQGFFYFDFNTSKIWFVKMDANGNILSNVRFADGVITGSGFIDLKIGPDGQLYILEYGAGCCPNNVGSGKLVRVDYTGIDPNKTPEVRVSADKVSGPLPLTVNFSSEGTNDPDGDNITFEWDFESDGIVDSNSPNPAFTYTGRGTFNALLRVRDTDGAVNSASVQVFPGNTEAGITFLYPPEGGMFAWEDQMNYQLRVDDAEDGSTADGSIDCSEVSMVPAFGHLSHTHDGLTIHQCAGEFLLDPTSHDAQGQDNIYYGFKANFEDSDGLMVFNQILVFPKLMEAEFFNTQNNTKLMANTDVLGGGVYSVRALSDASYIVFDGRNLLNIDSVAYRVSTSVGSTIIELRADSPTGPLLSTAAIPTTGSANRWATAVAPVNDPGGKHDLYVVFRNPGAINFLDLNYVEFLGNGISTDITPPEIYSVSVVNQTQVSIRFNEALDGQSALNSQNYSIDNGVQISGVKLWENRRTVDLFTSPLTVDAVNTLTISNISNEAGVAINQDIVTTFTMTRALKRVNAGGPLVDIEGTQWEASNYNTGGSATSKPSLQISNTTADEIYQSELNGNFSLNLPVGNPGVYDVRLHFAELVYKNPGERVFNVNIENGQGALTNYDIFSRVGYAAALTEDFGNIKVEDGHLTIVFTGVVSKAKISAVEVFYGNNGALQPAISITNPASDLNVIQPFKVYFKVENWWIGQGASHILKIVDGVPAGNIYDTEPITISGLSPGPHRIRLMLVTAAGDTTAYHDEVNINVTDGSGCVDNPFPLLWERYIIGSDLPYRAPHIVPVDIDGDGFPDIVTGPFWYRNPHSPKGIWDRNVIGAPMNNAFLVYDLDRDGDQDVLGTDGKYLGTQLAWAENDGSGNFVIHANIPQEAGFPPGSTNNNTFLAGSAIGNFNNVPNVQIALVWNGSETSKAPVKMLTVPADPVNVTWTVQDIAPNAVGEAIHALDIDNDGDLDLSQAKNWLRNDNGSWTTINTSITVDTYYEHHLLRDFDRNGTLDGVMTQIGDNKNIFFLNIPANPAQPWTKTVLGDDIDSGLSLDVQDMDFDGDLDVITAEWKVEKRLIAFENDLCNSGTWIRHVLDPGGLSAPDHHDGAQTADLDNDGDLDIVSLGWDKRTPRIYINNSSNVSPDNRPPVVAVPIDDQLATLGEAFNFVFPANTFADPDGDVLSYTAVLSDGSSLPSWLSFTATERLFKGTPPVGTSQPVMIKVTARDINGGSVADQFAITFANIAPVVANPVPDQTAVSGSAFTFTFAANTFTDANGDTLTYSATLSAGGPLPAWLAFDAGSRTFSGTPSGSDVGTFDIRLSATDGEATVNDVFRFTVTDPSVNQPPAVENPIGDKSAFVDMPFTFTVPVNTFSDPNGDPLTYSATRPDDTPLPGWLTFDGASRTFSGTPGNSDVGTVDVRLTASDSAYSASAAFRIMVVDSAGSVRVNSGGPDVTASGLPFSADKFFSGGGTYKNLNIADVAGTDADDIYRTERYGNFSYQVPLSSGTYLLRLHFAEIYFGATGGGKGGVGTRVFNVTAEGTVLLSNFDIFKEAGGSMTAVIREFEVSVTDGVLNVGFVRVVQNPKVSAIEVIPLSQSSNESPVVSIPIPDQVATAGAPFAFTFNAATFSDADNDVLTYSAALVGGAPLPAWLSFNSSTRTFSGTPPAAGAYSVSVTALDGRGGFATDAFALSISGGAVQSVRVNSGGPAVSTSSGDGFSADQFNAGGSTYTNNNIADIAGTVDDVLYRTERYKMSAYNIPVTPGIHLVRLHFAEIYFGATGGGAGGVGKRVFSVSAEGVPLLTDFDIYAEAGSMTAVVKEFEVDVADGTLNLTFTAKVNNAKVSAIEVIPQSPDHAASTARVAQSSGSLRVDPVSSEHEGFHVYPNPLKDQATLEFEPVQSGEVELQVINMFGSVVSDIYSGPVTGQGFYRYEFDASALTNGVYFARLRTAERTVFVKLLVSR